MTNIVANFLESFTANDENALARDDLEDLHPDNILKIQLRLLADPNHYDSCEEPGDVGFDKE